MLDDTTTPGAPVSRTGLTRRQVVKAGAHTAWLVPAISVATAVPALAVSGQGALTTSAFTAYFEANGQNFVLDLGPIKNTGAGTTGQVTVVFRIPRQTSGPFSSAPRLIGPRPTGWSYAGSGTYSGGWTYTFVSHEALDPGESTPRLKARFSVTGKGTCSSVQITATASANNATPAATATSLQCPAGS
jgi:hypothetical protein